MVSKTQIANFSLSKLGQPAVANIDTDSVKAARIMSLFWDKVRGALLTENTWRFSIKRIGLAPDVDAPSWGYSYSYTVPSDFRKLIRVKDNIDYDLEGDKILTNDSGTLYISYIADITDPTVFPSTFVEVLSSRLAYEACEELTQSNTKKDMLLREYDYLIKIAKNVDISNDPIEDLEEDDWVIRRY